MTCFAWYPLFKINGSIYKKKCLPGGESQNEREKEFPRTRDVRKTSCRYAGVYATLIANLMLFALAIRVCDEQGSECRVSWKTGARLMDSDMFLAG